MEYPSFLNDLSVVGFCTRIREYIRKRAKEWIEDLIKELKIEDEWDWMDPDDRYQVLMDEFPDFADSLLMKIDLRWSIAFCYPQFDNDKLTVPVKDLDEAVNLRAYEELEDIYSEIAFELSET